MKIKVIGKAHLEGTSKKTGKPYNLNQLHYVGKAQGVEGDAAMTMPLDPTFCPYAAIIVGGEYDVEFGPHGRVMNFTPCK